MKSVIFLLLAAYAVECWSYIIQIPENDSARESLKQFKVYWNVPTFQCTSKKIPFNNLYEKYGIIQNEKDSFLGDKISILYESDFGLFPALRNSSGIKFKNGGVPQEGDLEKHLKKFRNDVERKIPDKDFSGIGVIDQETFRPAFRQNFGSIIPQKDLSYELERKMHWKWPKAWIQTAAKLRFEKSAREFMQTTLSVAKQMRPNALWGYYAFPYCFNMASDKKQTCSETITVENDCTHWLWEESTALYPTLYSSKSLSTWQLSAMVRGRVLEASRVSRGRAVILPYIRFRYENEEFLTKKDMEAVIKTLYESDASGVVIWGSSTDVNTKSKCNDLVDYVKNILGPAIAKYLKPAIKEKDKKTTEKDTKSTTTSPNKSTNIISNITSKTTIAPILDDYTSNNTIRTTINPISVDYTTNIDTTTINTILEDSTTNIDTNYTTTMNTISDNSTSNIDTTYSTAINTIFDSTTNTGSSYGTARTAINPNLDDYTNNIDSNNTASRTTMSSILDAHTTNIDSNYTTTMNTFINEFSRNIYSTRTTINPILDEYTTNIDSNHTTSMDTIIDESTTNIDSSSTTINTILDSTTNINSNYSTNLVQYTTNTDSNYTTTRTTINPNLDDSTTIIDESTTNIDSNSTTINTILDSTTNMNSNYTTNLVHYPTKIDSNYNSTTTTINPILDDYTTNIDSNYTTTRTTINSNLDDSTININDTTNKTPINSNFDDSTTNTNYTTTKTTINSDLDDSTTNITSNTQITYPILDDYAVIRIV